jgi:hypothetical protein
MLTQGEFEELINDFSKRIDGDIQWTVDNNVLWAKFRAEVITDSGYDLFIQGSFNPFISALIPNPTWLPPKWFRANAIRPYGLAFL